MKQLVWVLFFIILAPATTLAEEEGGLTPTKQIVEQARAQIREIDVDELDAMLEQGAIIIDVREPDETSKGTIPEAEVIPRGMLEFRVGRLSEDPDQPIVVYCRSGNRAALAALSLQSMGYRQVYSLEGGWKAWKEAQELEALSPRDPQNR